MMWNNCLFTVDGEMPTGPNLFSFSESYGGDVSGAYSAEQGQESDTDIDLDEMLPYDDQVIFPIAEHPMERDSETDDEAHPFAAHTDDSQEGAEDKVKKDVRSPTRKHAPKVPAKPSGKAPPPVPPKPFRAMRREPPPEVEIAQAHSAIPMEVTPQAYKRKGGPPLETLPTKRGTISSGPQPRPAVTQPTPTQVGKPGRVPPTFTQYIENSRVVPGETAKFTIQVSGEPLPDLKWFKNDKEIKDSPESRITTFSDGTSILELPNVGPNDSGRIMCKAENHAGLASCIAKLIVIGKYFLSRIEVRKVKSCSLITPKSRQT